MLTLHSQQRRYGRDVAESSQRDASSRRFARRLSTGAKAIDTGRGALANATDVVPKEASAADLGTKMDQLDDKVMQTVTKNVVKPA
jgi:hypothetical protein